jgi:ABC-type transport system involved in multi-copper enzyme maturation permease subunit
MLWYKTWLETQSRFFICLIGCTLLCAVFIFHTQRQGLADTKAWFYYSTMFYAHQYLTGMWVLSSVLLGVGGLVREASIGTAGFTLALPVSRKRLAWVRIASGLAQMVSLAVVPWIAISVTTVAGGHPFIWTQAVHFVLLLIGGGIVYFAIAVLVSSVVEKEYTAPTVALGIIILISVLPGIFDALRPYSLLRLMGGSAALDRTTYLLAQPFPWATILGCLTAASMLLWVAVIVVERREF